MARIINFIILFLINLKRNFFKEIFVGFGIILATLTLIVGTSLVSTMEKIYTKTILDQIPLDEVIVQGTMRTSGLGPKTIRLGPFTFKSTKEIYNITPKILESIRKWPEVKSVIPVSKANFPVIARISLKLPRGERRFFAEPPVIGIPDKLAEKYLKKYLTKRELQVYKRDFPGGFNRKNGVIPILIPTFLGEITKNFMKTNSLPNIDIIKLRSFIDLEILMNRSLISGKKSKKMGKHKSNTPIKAKVVGYIDSDISSGIAIPQSELEKVKRQVFSKKQSSGFEAIIVKIKNPAKMRSIKKKLKKLARANGLVVQQNSLFTKLSKYIEKGIAGFKSLVNQFSGLILIISGIAIFYAFLYLFFQRESEMSLYRFFGASRFEIILIPLLEAAFVGFICAMTAYGISYYLLTVYFPENLKSFEKLLPDTMKQLIFRMPPENLITFNHWHNFRYVLMAMGFSMASALIPSVIGAFRPIKR